MAKVFEIETPDGRRRRLPFAFFAEAVAGILPGYEILSEYDGAIPTRDDPPIYVGGELVALINREDPNVPLSRYIRTDVSKARPVRLDDELVAFIQGKIDSGHITPQGLCRTGEGVSR